MGGWLARCMGGWLWQVSYAVENPEKPWKLELLHMESPGEVDEWWNFYLGYLCLNRLTESLGSGSEPINVFADILLANLVSELNCLPRKKWPYLSGSSILILENPTISFFWVLESPLNAVGMSIQNMSWNHRGVSIQRNVRHVTELKDVKQWRHYWIMDLDTVAANHSRQRRRRMPLTRCQAVADRL